jgi:hypothetical protein
MAMHPLTRARTVLVLTSIVAVAPYVLHRAKFLVFPFIWLGTYLHEVLHGFTSLVFHAQFRDLRIWSDGTGMAFWHGDVSALGRSVIAITGLVAPVMISALFFALAKKASWARAGLILVALFLVASSILVVRNPFGWIVALSWAFALFGISRTAPLSCELWTAILGVQLSLTLLDRLDDLFGEQNMGGISDAAAIADALVLPAFAWGVVVSGFALFVVLWGTRRFFKTHTVPAPKPVAAPIAPPKAA